MKKLILSLSIVAVAIAGSAQGITTREAYKKTLSGLKTLTLVSDTAFFLSAGFLIHGLIPGSNCVTVPAAICTQTLAPVALPIISTYFSTLTSMASRVVTMMVKADAKF